MPELLLLVRGRVLRRVRLDRPVTTIGRGPDNTVVLDDVALSRRHARLLREQSEVQIVDLSSRGGIWVNDRRVDGSVPLRPGDVVTLGSYSFRFVLGFGGEGISARSL